MSSGVGTCRTAGLAAIVACWTAALQLWLFEKDVSRCLSTGKHLGYQGHISDFEKVVVPWADRGRHKFEREV